MRQYEVLAEGYYPVDFDPDNEALEVIQNVRTILATPKFSVPLLRDFGVENGLTDSPINTAGAKLKSDIIMAVRKYEPRAEIVSLTLEPSDNGRIITKLTIRI